MILLNKNSFRPIPHRKVQTSIFLGMFVAGFFLKKIVFTFSESGLFFSFSLFFVLTCCKLGALDFIILPVVNYLVELLNQSRHINTFP